MKLLPRWPDAALVCPMVGGRTIPDRLAPVSLDTRLGHAVSRPGRGVRSSVNRLRGRDRGMRRIASLTGIVLIATLAGCRGEHEGPGEVTRRKVPDAAVAEHHAAQEQAAAAVAKAAGI